jgi:hypothetical protein
MQVAERRSDAASTNEEKGANQMPQTTLYATDYIEKYPFWTFFTVPDTRVCAD